MSCLRVLRGGNGDSENRGLNYYPFGLEMNGDWNQNSDYNYTYNGKEVQSELDLGYMNYGFRFYDPSIGRFLSTDPAADIYAEISPYAYVANNPVLFIDPTGAYIEFANDEARDLYNKIYENASDETKAIYDRLHDSDVVFRIKSEGADEGYNGITKIGCDQDCGDQFVVDVIFDGSQDSDSQINALGDELEHARQFEDGELALVEMTDGSSVGGNSFDLTDERKSKDAGLNALESTKEVAADPNGTNAQKYKYYKNRGLGDQYILSFPQYAPLGNRRNSIPASADARSINAPVVRQVVYRNNGRTVVKNK